MRVSTEEQARKGYSLSEQRVACRQKAQELAAQHDPAPPEIDEFVDDFGGDIAERPQLEALRTFVRERRPAWVVCMDPDRFSRSLKLQLIIADAIEAQQTRLAFVQQEYDPTDIMSKAFFQFRGLMSELDKAKILERTARGKRGKVRAGKRPNGATPFGYVHNRELDQLEVYEPEAAWVRRIFTWVADDHLSLPEVARRLAELGVPCKRSGSTWHRSVVRGLLENTTYYGEMRCYRKDFQGLGAIRRLPRARRRPLSARLRPPEEWVLIPVPAIVDRALWARAAANLQATTRRGGRRDTGLLSMLLRCGQCGAAMSYARRSGGRHYIRCKHRYPANGLVRCSNPHHRAERVEEAAWSALCEFLTEPALIEQHLSVDVDNRTAHQRLAEDLRSLQERLEAELRVQAVTIQKQAQGRLAESVADSLLAQSQRQVTHLRASIAIAEERLRSVNARALRSASDARSVQAEAEAVRRLLSLLCRDMRRALILRVVRHVTVQPNGAVIVTIREVPPDAPQDC